MEKWYILFNLVFTIWVLADGLKRKVNTTLWAIGTLLFGSYIFPVYIIARRPLKAGESQEEGGATRRFFKNSASFLAIFVWTVIMIAAGIWHEKPPANAMEGESSEYKLAVLNSKDNIGKGDATVARFGSLLDELSNNCVEDRQQIAGISLIAHKKIKAYGIKDGSLMNIMEGINTIFRYSELKNQKYTEYAFAYVRLRQFGQSHKQALEGLQTIARGY